MDDRAIARRRTLLSAGAFALTAAVALAGILASPDVARSGPPPTLEADMLLDKARAQIGVTVRYDPSYAKLDYPMGDVPRDRGVCSDVLVRAYRDAFGLDLQVAVHRDMTAHFREYPTYWGLKRPDRNIDHRRVLNLQVFFTRHGEKLAVTDDPDDYRPGDIVSQAVGPDRLPHIGIVAYQRTRDGKRPLVIHNIGAGTRIEDILFEHPITGHYRYFPKHVGG